jgi:AAT family amino acid transporter
MSTENGPRDGVYQRNSSENSNDHVDVKDAEKHQSIEDQDNMQHVAAEDKLARKLSARQVQMIAIGGTIGTGLFLGTGKSLATGGPASMLIGYMIVGFIVFITMLSLGEMATFIPVAGSFCTFAG